MTLLHGKNYGRPTLDLNFAENKSLIDTVTGRNLITFSRSQSGKEATYVGSDGLIKYAGADEPRFDYNPETGESLGLLIEEQRTNLLIYSEDFSITSAWVTSGSTSVQSSEILAPDNSPSVYKIREDTSTGPHRFLSGVSNNVSVTINLPYTISFFVKNAGRDYAGIRLNTSSGDICSGNVRLSDATVTETTAGTITATSVGNGWVRIVGTGTSPATSNAFPEIRASNSDIYSNYTGDGTSGIYVWGAQVESGSFPTSYIPTSGSTVTRNADEASITGTNFSSWYNQSEGSVFCDGASISNRNSSYWSIGQTTTANGATVLVYPQNTITFQVVDSTFQVNRTVFSGTVTDRKKTAVGLKQTNFASVINGGSVILDTSGSLPVNLNKLRIGNYLDGGTVFDYSGTISRLTYWPKRLPDLELQQLTK